MLMNQGSMIYISMMMRVNERGERFHAPTSRRCRPCQYDCRPMQPKIERPFCD